MPLQRTYAELAYGSISVVQYNELQIRVKFRLSMREEQWSGICGNSIEAEELQAASSFNTLHKRHQTAPQRLEVNTDEINIGGMDDESVAAGIDIERVMKCCKWRRPPAARKLARDSGEEIVSR